MDSHVSDAWPNPWCSGVASHHSVRPVLPRIASQPASFCRIGQTRIGVNLDEQAFRFRSGSPIGLAIARYAGRIVPPAPGGRDGGRVFARRPMTIGPSSLRSAKDRGHLGRVTRLTESTSCRAAPSANASMQMSASIRVVTSYSKPMPSHWKKTHVATRHARHEFGASAALAVSFPPA